MDLKTKIFDYFKRKSDLRVLFIFDNGLENYQPLLEEIIWPSDYHYEVFDGRTFRFKYNLEHEWRDLKVVLLINGPAPANEQSYLNFPLLDILTANLEFKEDSAEIFMQERHIRPEYYSLIKNNIKWLQGKWSGVDKLLSDHYADLTPDHFYRAIITVALKEGRGEEALTWTAIFGKLVQLDLTENSKKLVDLLKLAACKEAVAALEKKASDYFGYQCTNGNAFDEKSLIQFCARSLKYNAICLNLSLAPGDNYAQYKVTNALERITAIWEQLPKNEENRGWLSFLKNSEDIKEQTILQIYGVAADYWYSTPDLTAAILAHLATTLKSDPNEANKRLRLLTDCSVGNGERAGIEFLQNLANYYGAQLELKYSNLAGTKEFITAYTSDFYKVDLWYRKAVEQYYQALNSEIPLPETFEQAKNLLDQDYAKLANAINQAWLKSVQKEGSLRQSNQPRQENFFADHPNSGNKLVVIISDAFRYELGTELVKKLAEYKTAPSLDYALAQVPTETKYCKTTLLPHQKLQFVLDDQLNLAVDGKCLTTLEQREQQLKNFVPDAICLNYADLIGKSKNEQRELFKHKLVYIFHDDIDTDGHDQNGQKLCQSCHDAVTNLSKLIKSLHDYMNVSKVILTADHGFLFNDLTITEKDKYTVSEESLEKKSRYYLTKSAVPVFGLIKLPLAESSAITDSGLLVATPNGTNRMAASGGYKFTHGGMALQEIIIPIVTSSYKREDNKQKVDFSLLDTNLRMVSSTLKVRILQNDPLTARIKERTLIFALYDHKQQVTNEVALALNSDNENIQNRLSEVKLALNRSTTASILELRIFDQEDSDRLNPIKRLQITNVTLIEQDF